MRLIRVEITADDIASGKPGECQDCAAALALGRALPGADVALHGDRYVVNGRWYPSPDELRAFVRAFDGVTPKRPAPGPLTVELQVEDGVAVAEWADMGAAA